MTLLLSRADVASVLTLADCLPVVEGAFRRHGTGETIPPKSVGMHADAGTFHLKTAIAEVFAAKLNANFPGNPQRHGLPTIQGLILLMDLERGTPLAVLDSALITSFRTAAATAVAVRALSRNDAATLTVIGCGEQGRSSLEAIGLVRTIRRVYVIDADAGKAARFAREMQAAAGMEILAPSSIDDAVADSDIVVTCTTARAPILEARHLHPGLFIAGVGADNPEKHELAPQLLLASEVVVDILEQAATMGDLHHAIVAGTLTRESIHGELADVLCGRARGRSNDQQVFVFDSTGTALQDVAVAFLAFTSAAERGVGLELAFA